MINPPFLKKSKVGLNISTDYISYAELEKNGKEYRVKDIKFFDSKGCIRPSLTDENITDPTNFKEAIKTLIGNKRLYASIGIPDASVKTAIFEFESLPQKTGEIEKLIKWKMEKSLPFIMDDAQISYQALNKNNILVSVIRKGILCQYEELLREAGVEPVLIDTASSHTFNLFHDIIIWESKDFIFLSLMDNAFVVMIIKKGCPDFIRAKGFKSGGADRRIKNEVLASLRFYSHSKAVSDLKNIYYLSDINIDENGLIEDSAMQVKRLGIEQIKWLKGGERRFNLLPAIGAAMERE